MTVVDAEPFFEEWRRTYPEAAAEAEGYGRVIRNTRALVQALDERRVELNISKAELARRAHLPASSVRRLFSRSRNPTAFTVFLLAEALDVDVDVRLVPRSGSRRHTA